MSPDSPWPSAVARATQVHRAERSQPGRAFAAIIHAGSARAHATRGLAPSKSPTRQSPLAVVRRRQAPTESQNTPPNGKNERAALSASTTDRPVQPRLKTKQGGGLEVLRGTRDLDLEVGARLELRS